MSTIEVSAAGSARRAAAAHGLVWIIRAYQAGRVGHVSPCRFTPTCSHYAVEALETHGAGRGLSLIVRRLARCRPGGPSGFDPVPPCDLAHNDLESTDLEPYDRDPYDRDPYDRDPYELSDS